MTVPSWFIPSCLNAVAQLVRMATGLIVLKIIVATLGTEGVGKLGHFMSLISLLIIFAGGGISNGVIKYVAEYKDSPEKLTTFLVAASYYSFGISALLAILLISCSEFLSLYLFGVAEWSSSFVVIGVLQFGFAILNVTNSLINGLKRTSNYSIIVIAGSFLGVLPAHWLAEKQGIAGAVIALILIQLAMLVPTIPIVLKILKETKFSFVCVKVEFPYRNLAKFSLMQLASVSLMTIAEVSIRNMLVEHNGWAAAGIWQGVMRISYAYISLFASFLAVYYMPTLASMSEEAKKIRYVLKTIALVGFLFAFFSFFVFLFREQIFVFALSKEFNISPESFFFQLAGDFFRLMTYVIGFYVISRANAKLSICMELLQATIYILTVYCFFNFSFEKNVFLAYMVTYGVYFLFCVAGLLFFLDRNDLLKGCLVE